jgi:hypothetical protein
MFFSVVCFLIYQCLSSRLRLMCLLPDWFCGKTKIVEQIYPDDHDQQRARLPTLALKLSSVVNDDASLSHDDATAK